MSGDDAFRRARRFWSLLMRTQLALLGREGKSRAARLATVLRLRNAWRSGKAPEKRARSEPLRRVPMPIRTTLTPAKGAGVRPKGVVGRPHDPIRGLWGRQDL